MYNLRNRWKTKIEKALQFLSESSHPIAQFTLQTLNSKELTVKPFSEMTADDVFEMACFEGKKSHLRQSPTLLNNALKKVRKEHAGCILDNHRIYIREDLDDDEFVKTLVHEVNHYLNQIEYDEDDCEQKFLDELRTHTAEEMLMLTKPLTRAALRNIAEDVASRNKVPLPDKISFPEGQFYAIPKKLR